MEMEAYKIDEISSALKEQKMIVERLHFGVLTLEETTEDFKKLSKTIERIEKAIRPYDQFRDSPSYP